MLQIDIIVLPSHTEKGIARRQDCVYLFLYTDPGYRYRYGGVRTFHLPVTRNLYIIHFPVIVPPYILLTHYYGEELFVRDVHIAQY